MSDKPDVRRLQPADAGAWAVLRHEALEAHPLVFGASSPGAVAPLADIARTRIAQPESVILGAFTGERLQGIVGVLREQGAKERHKAFIWGMYVTPSARRGGIGAALVRAAIGEARSWRGVDQVHLSVSDRASAAQALYERAGFRAWGREPRALCVGGESADEIHMVLDIRSGDGG